MKSKVFNTEMVQAILKGDKTQFREPIKMPKYMQKQDNGLYTLFAEDSCYEDKGFEEIVDYIQSPYQVGDTIFVKETWNYNPMPDNIRKSQNLPNYFYKANKNELVSKYKWRPALYMPLEAARIFLKIKDIKVQRLQDITESEALDEGKGGESLKTILENNPYFWAKMWYKDFWNSKYEKKGYGWNENPWVWCVEFERVEKSEADGYR